jgi:hypothetical protein
MKRDLTLVLPHAIVERLHRQLFPGDGLEAAALLYCSEVRGRRKKWLARDILPVPYSACARTMDSITWPGEYLETAIDEAEERGDIVIAMHSHPGGLLAFSCADDDSDHLVMPALWHGTGRACGSAIMTPDGTVLARAYKDGINATPVDLVLTAAPDINLYWHKDIASGRPVAPPMAFGSGMTEWLRRLSVCVIGVSGTGSIVAEQLARLGVGELNLIDFDCIEARNLNRILNASLADCGRLKVDVFADSIRRHNPECHVVTVPHALGTREAVLAASEADLAFSCVDTAEGRHIADRLCAALCIPVVDVGVTIPTVEVDGMRRIAEVCGRVDYIFPSGTSLLDRGVYDAALLEAEYLARVAPDTHARRIKEGYIRGMVEEAPSVISVNMRAASACVIEAIARVFPFRETPNAGRARTIFMLAEGEEETWPETAFQPRSAFPLGTGLCEPLLGLPALGVHRSAA